MKTKTNLAAALVCTLALASISPLFAQAAHGRTAKEARRGRATNRTRKF